jgi:hypothetical protein
MNDSTSQHFLELSAGRLETLSSRIDDCLGRLTQDQLWWRGTESQNAVANLVLHLCGNLNQFTAAITNQADTRNRDREFSSRLTATTAELRELLKNTVTAHVAALRSLPPARLMETVHVQNNDRQLMQHIYNTVGHFSEHVGQIVYATKLLTSPDSSFAKAKA